MNQVIRIRLDKSKVNTLINLHKQILSAPYKIQEGINIAMRNCDKNSAKGQFYSSVLSELNVILFGLPADLETLLQRMHPLYERALIESSTTLKSELKTIFNYDTFVGNYIAMEHTL